METTFQKTTKSCYYHVNNLESMAAMAANSKSWFRIVFYFQGSFSCSSPKIEYYRLELRVCVCEDPTRKPDHIN